LGAFFAPNEVEGPAFVFAYAAEPSDFSKNLSIRQEVNSARQLLRSCAELPCDFSAFHRSFKAIPADRIREHSHSQCA